MSLLTYKAIVAVRYPELVLHDQDPIQIGHFVAHDHTVEYGGFHTVLWEAPKDLRTAVEDVVVFLTYLQKRHRDLSHGATAQLLVLCNRTAVHNQLLQHGFQAAWLGRLRVTTTSSAAGATARIAVIVQTGWVGGWGSQYHVLNRGRWTREGRGGVKLYYSAGELLKAPVPNEP